MGAVKRNSDHADNAWGWRWLNLPAWRRARDFRQSVQSAAAVAIDSQQASLLAAIDSLCSRRTSPRRSNTMRSAPVSSAVISAGTAHFKQPIRYSVLAAMVW